MVQTNDKTPIFAPFPIHLRFKSVLDPDYYDSEYLIPIIENAVYPLWSSLSGVYEYNSKHNFIAQLGSNYPLQGLAHF